MEPEEEPRTVDDVWSAVRQLFRVFKVCATLFVVGAIVVVGIQQHDNNNRIGDLRQTLAAVQLSRVEACERINVRLKRAGDGLVVIIDRGADDPASTRKMLRPFLDPLQPEDCSKITKGTP